MIQNQYKHEIFSKRTFGGKRKVCIGFYCLNKVCFIDLFFAKVLCVTGNLSVIKNSSSSKNYASKRMNELFCLFYLFDSQNEFTYSFSYVGTAVES